MRLLVVGATGLVGSNVVRLATENGHRVRGTSRNPDAVDYRLAKTDEDAIREVVTDFNPDAIVDTAAFHAVDDCENQRELAWSVNAVGTGHLAIAAETTDAHLVHLSTDYVFPGDPSEAPYRETDPVNPVNYYGRTKLAGEQAARIGDRLTILRPSVIFGRESDNFATWAIGQLAEGNEISIVDDQVSRPTFAPDLAAACIELIDRDLTGLYHATGPVSLSRFEFTRTLADVLEFDLELVEPISTAELGQEAPRPQDSSLDSGALYDRIGEGFRSPKAAFREMQSDELTR